LQPYSFIFLFSYTKPDHDLLEAEKPQTPKLCSTVTTVGLNVHTITEWITPIIINGYFSVTTRNYKVLKPIFTRRQGQEGQKAMNK